MPFKARAEIRAELKDPQGNVIRRMPWRPARSLLKQFIQLLAAQMSQVNQTIKDTSGTDRTGAQASQNLQANAPAGTTTFGMLIGTGTNPVTMADYKLQTQVTAGIGHAAVQFAVENPDEKTWRVAISRIFTNNTAATLAIKEVALYAYFTSSMYTVCLDRSLYSVNVPVGVAVTLTYRITAIL